MNSNEKKKSSLLEKVKKVWENREQILEGIKNKIITNEHVEYISRQRMKICNSCPHIDLEGSKCLMPNTQPCCSMCGCSLELKTRSLSSECADESNVRWPSLLTEEEEDNLNLDGQEDKG